MKKQNTHCDHNHCLRHVQEVGALVLALCVASACAYEWVSTKPEIERYELESAKQICRRWAQKQVDDGQPINIPNRRSPQRSTRPYQSYFTECMKKYGWTRQPPPKEQPTLPTQTPTPNDSYPDSEPTHRPKAARRAAVREAGLSPAIAR